MNRRTHRRKFFRQAVAVSALSAVAGKDAATTSGQTTQQDSGIVIWLGHTDLNRIAENMAKCADHGFRTVYVEPRYVGKALYHSKVVALFDSMYALSTKKDLSDALRRFDPYDVSVREAKRHGLRFIAEISIFDRWFPGLEDRFYEQHPQYLMLHKDQGGLPYPGVPCYAEKAAQDYCLAEVKELVGRGAEGIAFDMGSHQIGWTPPGRRYQGQADSFGFNPPVVEEFKRRYGVDVQKESFDKKKWYALQGEFFTQFLRRVKAEIKETRLEVGVTPEGYLGYGAQPHWTGSHGAFSQAPAVRIDLEWQKWLQEGIVDVLRVYVGPNGPFGPYYLAVAEAMKRQSARGRFYLHVRGIAPAELCPLASQVRASTLDGYSVAHSGLDFPPCAEAR